MNIIAFDPGLRCCGMALFNDGKLIEATAPRSDIKSPVRDVPAWVGMAAACREVAADWPAADLVVYEMPEVYLTGGKGDPNDLMQLTGVLGAVSGVFSCRWEGYLPVQWKGQLDKDVHHARIREFFLTAAELRRMEGQLDSIISSLQHNALDAVGLGLFYLKRDRR
jgi:hypothetical protein